MHLKFRSDVSVELLRSLGGDADVVDAARVSTAGRTQSPGGTELITYLMRERHGSPFEHNSFTFYIEAPIFVFREFMRHRVGFSYSEESARYRRLEPTFYVPAPERDLVQVGRAGHYRFEAGSAEQHAAVVEHTHAAYRSAYRAYEQMLAAGVAREVARTVLPVGTYSSMYTTCNARSLMNFLSLRVHDEHATFPSYPQREIQMVAEQMQAQFARIMPVTYSAFLAHGRVAP